MKTRKGGERRDVGIRAWTRSDYICDGVGCASARAQCPVPVGLLDGMGWEGWGASGGGCIMFRGRLSPAVNHLGQSRDHFQRPSDSGATPTLQPAASAFPPARI